MLCKESIILLHYSFIRVYCMFLRSLFYAIVLFSNCGFLKSQIPSYVPTNGLAGYWPFDGNANDYSGNGRNGTIIGPILTSGRQGQNNTAYYFDGIDDRIYLGDWFNYFTFTISMWVKPGIQNNGFAVIIDNNHSSSQNWVCQATSNWQNNKYSFISSNEFQLSAADWSHLVLAYSSNQVYVYINGSLISQTSHNLVYGRPTSLYLGYWQVDIARYWKGSIDNIGIWNRVLTGTEILGLYQGSYCQPPTTVRF
jgi:hypothetical protein